MNDQPIMYQKIKGASRGKLSQAVIASLMLLTLLVCILALASALQTVRRPFLGAFVEPTLVVNNVGDDSWNGRAAGLDLPDRLVALDGQPLTRPEALYEQVSSYKAGDVVTLTVEGEYGARRQVTVTLQSFPSSALIGYFVFPYGIGLAYLLIGLVVFVTRRDQAAGRAFALFCVAFALATGLLFDLYTTHRLVQVWVIGLATVGGSLIHLALVFPQRSRLVQRWPWISLLGYALAGVIALRALAATTDLEAPWAYIPAWRPLYLYTALGVLLWVAMLLWRRIRTQSPMVREQTRVILLGVLVASPPLVSWFFLASLGVDPGFQPTILFAPLVLLPLSIGYAILRYRLLDVDRVISQGVSYGLLTVLIVGSYALLINLLGLLLGTTIEANNPALVALFVLGVTLAFNPLRTHLHWAVERLFYRDRIDYRQALEAYSHELGHLLDQAGIFTALTAGVEAAVHPQRLLFFIYDETTAQFAPVSLRKGPFGGVRFSPEGGLAQLLVTMQESLYLMVGQPLPEELAREAHQLEAVRASLYIPVPKHGWMALGEKRSGTPYTSNDLNYLGALGDQTGLALDKVQLISDLRRRVNELNGLYRISRAVNSSLELQTVLSLITEKAAEISEAEASSLFLKDPETGGLVFEVTTGPHSGELVGLRVPPGKGITGAVAQTQEPIIVNDVHRHPHWFPAIDERSGFITRNMLAVPLISEEKSIGVLEVLNKKDGSSFDEQDQRLLLAFASQVAVTIENARLYSDVRRMKEFNEGLIQSMAEGIVVTDAEGRITLANPAAATLLGYAPGELVDQRWMTIIPSEQHPIVTAADERRMRGKVDSYEIELVHRSGRRIPVLVSGSPRFEEGRFDGTMAVFTDITEVLAHQKIEQELALAWQIQFSFLPDELPDVPGWQLAATLKPARETSGDFYDAIPLPGGRLGLLVADVTDKGTAAALYMAASYTLIRTYVAEFETKPALAFHAVHRRLLTDTKSDQFVTVFYGVLDTAAGMLTYCNAGHNPPYLLCQASRSGRTQHGPVAQELNCTGPPLGIRLPKEVTWEQRTVQLAPGDVLVLYSDGITEAHNSQRELFGERRLLAATQTQVGCSALELRDAIMLAIDEFVGDAPQIDDITLMVAVRGAP
jgi:PAS domain S-box-containing protein